MENSVEINLEIVGMAPIEDSTEVITKLAKDEEQAVAEVGGYYSSKVQDSNHCSALNY